MTRLQAAFCPAAGLPPLSQFQPLTTVEKKTPPPPPLPRFPDLLMHFAKVDHFPEKVDLVIQAVLSQLAMTVNLAVSYCDLMVEL